MKLYFSGVVPDPSLEKILLANGYELTKRPPKVAPELVFFALKYSTSWKELEKIREDYPKAWITVIVSDKQLHDAEFYNKLLTYPGKNDVWLDSSWETLFWFALQRTLEARKNQQELDTLKSTSEKLIAQLEKDVDLAGNIQRSLLPKASPEIPGVSLAVKYLPAAGLGGDYYDIFEFGDRKRFGVLMADSKTHGMAAALLAVLLKVRLEEMKDRFPDSKSFIEYVNREFHDLDKNELAPLSLLYGILDRSSLKFHYTVAGPIRPLLWRDGKSLALDTQANPPLGTHTLTSFRENSIALKPGDLLILHTDGIEGPLASKGASAFDNLVQILEKKKRSNDPLEVQNELMALIDRHVETTPLTDDLTILHFAIDQRALYVAQSK